VRRVTTGMRRATTSLSSPMVNTHTHTHTHTHTQACMHTHIHTHAHTSVHAHTHTRIRTRQVVCVPRVTWSRPSHAGPPASCSAASSPVRVCLCVCVRVCVCMCVCLCDCVTVHMVKAFACGATGICLPHLCPFLYLLSNALLSRECAHRQGLRMWSYESSPFF
jgi:hypothetical protein